jgi:hypothetical protein
MNPSQVQEVAPQPLVVQTIRELLQSEVTKSLTSTHLVQLRGALGQIAHGLSSKIAGPEAAAAQEQLQAAMSADLPEFAAQLSHSLFATGGRDQGLFLEKMLEPLPPTDPESGLLREQVRTILETEERQKKELWREPLNQVLERAAQRYLNSEVQKPLEPQQLVALAAQEFEIQFGGRAQLSQRLLRLLELRSDTNRELMQVVAQAIPYTENLPLRALQLCQDQGLTAVAACQMRAFEDVLFPSPVSAEEPFDTQMLVA